MGISSTSYRQSIVLISTRYNAVCLGLVLCAILLMLQRRLLLAAAVYTLALCFKQMALYFAVPIFIYMLHASLQLPPRAAAVQILLLGSTVLGVLLLVFSPFLYHGTVGDVLVRVFPFQRGLFEDKVATFWCVSNLAIKWSQLWTTNQLIRLSASVTLLACIPSIVLYIRGVNRHPHQKRLLFLYMLSCCSLSFYLFSYHVHEKSILFPMLPITLLIIEHPLLVPWVACIACFSMYPLLVRDELSWFYLTNLGATIRLAYTLPRPALSRFAVACLVVRLALQRHSPHRPAPPSFLPCMQSTLPIPRAYLQSTPTLSPTSLPSPLFSTSQS